MLTNISRSVEQNRNLIYSSLRINEAIYLIVMQNALKKVIYGLINLRFLVIY